MKLCTGCKEEKEEREFHKDNASPDGLRYRCKTCRSTEAKLYHKTYENTSRRHRKQANVLKLVAYLKEHPCVDCGEDDIIVLEFDHLPEFEKKANISRLMDYSWEIIAEEIAKCEVRCANCHRRKTAQRAGWSKLLL